MVFLCCTVMLFGLIGRLVYLMGFRSDYYYEKAQDLHERERDIKAARGKILDANGKVLADNKTVCTISVIHSQIKEPEKVISMLVKELGMEEDAVRKRVEKVSSIERIKTNVEKEVGDTIRDYELEGVKVDEDYKRYYPYGSLASKVLGFTGGDNQGIIGLEVKYEEVLSGTPGKILTTTDARGVEIDEIGESRVDPVAGDNLQISLDANIQEFVQQAALKVMEEKQADRVSILLMNPQNGEIYACVNVPEFDLNDPFTLNTDTDTSGLDQQQKQDLLNQMWRNPCLNDTYEPGSTFKIITMSAGLEAGVVSVNDRFYCPGYKLVDDRRIHCANRRGHGSQNFIEGAQNSCNPVFIEVGLRLGIDNYYKYFQQFGLMKKNRHRSSGRGRNDHAPKGKYGKCGACYRCFWTVLSDYAHPACDDRQFPDQWRKPRNTAFRSDRAESGGNLCKKIEYPAEAGIVSAETSETVRKILESVVSEGSGRNAKIEGYTIGGKTATSQTLPRSANRYISSFLGFAPAENPRVLGLCIIHNPQGIYYGGTIAAPVIRSIFENVLPYLGIEKTAEVEEVVPES